MAITIQQQPQAYMPGYNNQWFTAVSNQIAQPNFKYTVIVTDLISGDTATFQLPPRPDTLCVFDAGAAFAENQIRTKNYIPINTYGWQVATGVRKIRVNIGETYGSTPTYYAGSNIDYIIWNGYVDWESFPDYDKDDYVYTTSPVNRKWFYGISNDLTFTDRSNYLYALTSQAGDLYQLQIRTYNSAGALLGTSYIDNPFQATTNYINKYICIDVGHKGLTNIPSGQVTGTYPIITSSVAYYEIYDNPDPLVPAPVFIKRIDILCEPKYEVLTVHYLAKNGAFLSLNFNKVWNSDTDKNVKTFTQNTQDINPATGDYGYNAYDSPVKALSIVTQTRLKLRTNFVTDEQVTQYRECFDSPICYLDRGSSRTYLAIRPVTGSYKNLPRYANRLTTIEMDFEFSHQNARQRAW